MSHPPEAANSDIRLSIVMPTLNSERTIHMALESIARQDFDKTQLEILVVDGGSIDRTRDIANEFGCRIIDNALVTAEDGKNKGLTASRGRYALLMDSDEVLLSATALSKKIAALENHPEVRNIVTAGLQNPVGYSGLNDYANRFGEPFSFFMYRIDGGDYVESMRKRYRVIYEDDHLLVAHFSKRDILPICDAGGHCFDLSFLRELTGESYVPALFNRMAEHTMTLAVVKGDFMLHYSTVSLKQFLSKLRWRIITNVHKQLGNEGFINRERYAPPTFRLKKYVFPLYAFTLIGPLVDSALLTIRYRKSAYLLHFPLAVYTAAFIVWQYLRKALGRPPRVPGYTTGAI